MAEKKKILIVSTHFDDFVIACSGYIQKMINKNKEVHVLFVTGPHEPIYNKEVISNWQHELDQALSLLKGINGILHCDFEAGNMGDTISDSKLITELKHIFSSFEIVVIPSEDDYNTEHQFVSKCAKVAALPFKNNIKLLMEMETPSSSEFGNTPIIVNYFIDISEYIGIKTTLLNYFKSELLKTELPNINGVRHPDYVINYNKVRGHQIGVKYAECFRIIRCIR